MGSCYPRHADAPPQKVQPPETLVKQQALPPAQLLDVARTHEPGLGNEAGQMTPGRRVRAARALDSRQRMCDHAQRPERDHARPQQLGHEYNDTVVHTWPL